MKTAAIISASIFLTTTLGLATPQAAIAQEQGSIQILSAVYGKANASHPVNFTTRLQQTCGPSAVECQAYCSNAFVGHADRRLEFPFHPVAICRVTYRCGAQETLIADAERNDEILLSCRQRP
jgi:hypothetical protein